MFRLPDDRRGDAPLRAVRAGITYSLHSHDWNSFAGGRYPKNKEVSKD